MRGEEAGMIEVAYPNASGKLTWVEVNTSAIYSEGKITGLFGISRNITNRKRAEAIQKVMANISNATNTSDDLFELFKSIQYHLGKIIDTTNFFIALYEKETDLITLPYFKDEVDQIKSLPAGKSFTSNVIRNNKPFLITDKDIDNLVKTGELEIVGTKPKVWLGVPLRWSDEVVGAVVVQSYTEEATYSEEDFDVLKFVSDHIAIAIKRKQADEALRISEENYRTLAESIQDGVYSLDSQGFFTYVNNAIERRSGRTRDWFIGRHSLEILRKEDRDISEKDFNATMKGENIGMFEVAYPNAEGTLNWVEVNTIPIRKDNEIVGIFGVSRNINERKKVEEEIRKSAMYLDTMSDAILVGTVDTKIIKVNEASIKLWGYSADEFIGKLVLDLFPIEEHPKHKEEMGIAIKGGISRSFETIALTKEGIRIPIELKGEILKDEQGNIFGLSAVIRDITKRKRAEKELRESEEKYRNLFHFSNDAIFIHDLDMNIIDVNQKALDLMGYTEEEMLGMKVTQLHPKDALKKSGKALRDIQGKKHVSAKIDFKKKNGEIMDAINNSRIIEYEGGPAILGIVTDVTGIKLTEEKLKRSEEGYRKIFESTREGILITDLNGVITSANPGAAVMLGYESPKDLVGKAEEDFFLEPEKRVRFCEDLKEKQYLQNVEFQFIRKDGEIIHVLSTASIQSDVIDSDNINGEFNQQIIFMDLTDRKRAEEEMKRRLMKFRLEEGNFYLIRESTPTLSLEAFKDLQNIGFQGIVLSRTLKEELRTDLQEEFEYYWLAEKESPNSLKPTISEIKKKLEGISRRQVVLIDRLDYIVFKNGFKRTLSFVQYLRELIYLKGAIVILSIDPTTMKKDHIRLLEKECKDVEPLHKKIISDDLFNILKFTYRQNTLGIKPSYSAVGKDLGISKPTVRKRISDLISTGYLREDVKGRNKAIELTERGRQLFWK